MDHTFGYIQILGYLKYSSRCPGYPTCGKQTTPRTFSSRFSVKARSGQTSLLLWFPKHFLASSQQLLKWKREQGKKKDRHHGNGEEMRRVDLHVLQWLRQKYLRAQLNCFGQWESPYFEQRSCGIAPFKWEWCGRKLVSRKRNETKWLLGSFFQRDMSGWI